MRSMQLRPGRLSSKYDYHIQAKSTTHVSKETQLWSHGNRKVWYLLLFKTAAHLAASLSKC
jgi:hypothetical protein